MPSAMPLLVPAFLGFPSVLDIRPVDHPSQVDPRTLAARDACPLFNKHCEIGQSWSWDGQAWPRGGERFPAGDILTFTSNPLSWASMRSIAIVRIGDRALGAVYLRIPGGIGAFFRTFNMETRIVSARSAFGDHVPSSYSDG